MNGTLRLSALFRECAHTFGHRAAEKVHSLRTANPWE
jgi:hypothetical protein